MEIMIAVTIIGIITTLAVLGFRKSIAHQKLNGETGRAISKLRYITNEARVSKREICVYVNFQYNFIFAWADENENGVFDDTEAKIDSMFFESGINLLGGSLGLIKKNDDMAFYVHESGAPDQDIIVAVYSNETQEFKGLIIKETSGWVEEYELPSGYIQSVGNEVSG